MQKKHTIIPIKKKGVISTKVINEEQNEKNVDKIRNMTDKSTCFDIFYNAEIDGKRVIEK